MGERGTYCAPTIDQAPSSAPTNTPSPNCANSVRRLRVLTEQLKESDKLSLRGVTQFAMQYKYLRTRLLASDRSELRLHLSHCVTLSK